MSDLSPLQYAFLSIEGVFVSRWPLSVQPIGKGIVVAKSKRNPLDNIGTRLRELLEEMERLLNPPQPKPARVPIPVPVRTPRPTRRSYGQ
jgi:hypothetical protein